jgi:hypothetical protein
MIVLVLSVALTSYTDVPVPNEAARASAAPPATDAGMRAYVDPVTGEFLDQAVHPGADFPLATDAFNTSTEGLVEEDSPVSGTMVNLQGRFQHNYTAAVDGAGTLKATCDLPESTEANADKSESE